MKKVHCGPASQKKPVGGPNLTNIPAQTQFPPQRLPANEIRVPYQSSAPAGREVVQCCGFGAWLREKLCCGDGDLEIAEPARVDGPCAVAALRGLGWYAEGDADRLRIQTAAFGRLGRDLNDADTLLALGRAMILFIYPGNDTPFHVMYTDGAGNLCGENNDPVMLMNKFGIRAGDFDVREAPLLKIPIQQMAWNPDGGVILKYMTFEAYQNAVRAEEPEGGAGE